MKKIVAMLVVLSVCAASASAAQPVKSSFLSKCGLSSMKSMSDNDGMAVRGKFAAVSGTSSAASIGFFSGSSTHNSYVAVGHSVAAGASVSASYSFPISFSAAGGGAIAIAH